MRIEIVSKVIGILNRNRDVLKKLSFVEPLRIGSMLVPGQLLLPCEQLDGIHGIQDRSTN